VFVVILITSWITALAAQRAGKVYCISIDAATSGGGGGISPSYRQPDSAIGQELATGSLSNSGNFLDQPGVVQPWPNTPKSAATHWRDYVD
jgi:hypothetical protein